VTHGHHHAGRRRAELTGSADRSQRRLLLVLGLTCAYMLAQVVGGILTGSLALLADAGHMLADVLGLSMASFAIWFAQRPATAAKTYGFYRAEILAAVANSFLLFLVAGYILVEAWRRFEQPPEIAGLPMLAVALGGLAVNLVGMKLLRSTVGQSLGGRAAYLEVLADLLGSLGVIAGAIVISVTGWWQADPIISVAIGLFILPRTWSLLKNALDVLLEATPAGIDLVAIEATVRSLPGVKDVHDLHVWSIASAFVAMSAHVETESRRSMDVLRELQALLKQRFGIEHATLQVESADHTDGGAACALDPCCLVVGGRVPEQP
jgi:cobalt-zinc-cadmium efflux system protein